MRFLVVDDEEDVRVLLRIYLESLGHEVSEAKSAAEARRRCADEPRPDVMVLDVTLPDEDGPSLLRSLREEGTAPDDVVIMSAVSSMELDRIVADIGARSLTKPFTIDTLARMLLPAA